MNQETLSVRRKQVLYDEKWKVFLRRSRPWRHIPFTEFVLGAGSMATGNVHVNSDFDVIVAARPGRIFTARFAAILAFGVLGWRRRKLSHRESASDKVCLNHFVTEKTFRLAGPHDAYWKELYQNLVPIFGDPERVRAFFAANDWVGKRDVYGDDLRHVHRMPSRVRLVIEQWLSGPKGDRLEQFLKRLQIRRIERSLEHDPPGYKPRIRYSDDELEFHPDTVRIEQYVRKIEKLEN